MPKTFTSNVFSSSYKDDFVDSDNYHRILFNSGRAVQARELTQLQTIIQEEIGRFGRNIFKEGGAVNPGGPTITNDYEYVKLNTLEFSLPVDPSVLVGTTMTGTSSSVEAKVIEVVAATSTDPATLYVQYINTSSAEAGDTSIRFTAGERIDNTVDNLQIANAVGTDQPVGRGCKIANAEGDFFTRGHFVFAKGQSIILSKYTRYPTAVVGFKVTEDIVTTADDVALYDNQGVTPNLSSPGADRYRIRLTLTTKDQVTADENFVYYCDVLEGNIVDQVTGTDDYNKIADTLARRTSEESGNYIVNPFTVDFRDSGTNTIATISDGVAYVNGYRGASEKPTPLVIPKPRTTATIENQFTGISYGQYFICSELLGLLDIRTNETLNLSTSTTNPAASVTGTARVRAVEKDGNNFRVYLFDINMNSGQNLRAIKTIGTSTIRRAIPVFENNLAVIKESQKVNMVFGLPNPRPRIVSDFDYEVQRVFVDTASGGSFTLALGNNTESFSNTSQWIIVKNTDGVVVTNATFGAVGTQSLQISNLTNVEHTVYAKIQKGSPAVRQKTLTDATVTTTVSTVNGVEFIDLGKTDILSVSSVNLLTSSGEDVSHLFTLDNGQRAGFYDNGRMVLETGATAPTGNVYVAFKHFTHGAGDFFAVNSYTGQVDYEDIPVFSSGSGTRLKINLRDVIDFRNSVNSSGAFVASGATEIPTNGDIFQSDVEYYLPRADKIVVTSQGEIKNIQGEEGFATQIPATPENTLPLFQIDHNPYGLNDSDVVVVPFKAKRFTMGDIAQLENRVDKIEEATSLSLLELDTASLLVLDADGVARIKSGFFVDNFSSRSFSDTNNIEYRAGIDPSRGLLSVPTIEDDVILAYDSSKSTNTILKGDTVYLKYTESPTIVQTLVSGTENVNPFAVITGEGNITMSPATDNWFQTKYNPANVINNTAVENVNVDLGNINSNIISQDRNEVARWKWDIGNSWTPVAGFGSVPSELKSGWRGTPAWNWRGVPAETTRVQNVGNGNGGRQNSDFNVIRSFSNRIVVGERTVRQIVGDRTVSLTFLPFIRSRKVFFKAEGLRPNSQFFPFFDGKDVSAFCKDETFLRYGALATDLVYSNANRNATQHPATPSDLVSDVNGVIEGSFFIPSSPTTRFRAGTREFKLLDISKNDDDAALSQASFNYTAQGTLDTRQQTISSTRITQTRTRRWTTTTRVKVTDPLAQSFFVTNPSGIFVTKIQTYFKKVDSTGIPVQLQIRPMVNGHPSSTEIHAQSIKFVHPTDIDVPSSQTQANVVANPTTFEFDEPIFLNPETEYAIVLLAESIEYEAYVGETYAFELGSTEKRISRQPSMGSLFKSQNGTTWEPDQTKDLAFKIFTATFATSGSAVFENRDIDSELLTTNPLYMTSGSAVVTALCPNHGFTVNDTVNISGLVGGTSYNGVLGSNINGARTITAVDGFAIRFNAASAATSSGRFGADLVLVDKQIQFDVASPNFTTLIPDDTTLTYQTKLTAGKSLAAITGQQVKYGKDASYSKEVVIGDENYFASPRLIANPSNETSQMGGERSVTIKVDMATTKTSVSPIIDTQGASITTETNQIDNQIASGTENGFNIPLTYSAETNAFGGSALAKHLSIVGQLDEPARGLKVMLAAIRPNGSNIDLYYRTGTEGSDLQNTTWTLVEEETTVQPDERNFREYRYLIGGDTGTLNAFTDYQFKIVFRGNNSAKVPFIRDFRAIAMAT
jgi:hypothetical protein